MAGLEVLTMVVAMLFWLLILAGGVFWIWMVIDCARNEPSAGNDKLVWIIIVVFTHVVGASIYYFVRYRPRRLAQWDRGSVVQ
jgi:prolipoprotein diacylglyceryltransferase